LASGIAYLDRGQNRGANGLSSISDPTLAAVGLAQ
jgi:hypothetical protein